MTHTFSIQSSLMTGLNVLKKHMPLFITLAVVRFIFNAGSILSLVNIQIPLLSGQVSPLTSFIVTALQLVLNVIILRLCINLYENESFSPRDLSLNIAWYIFAIMVADFIYIVICVLGLLCLIIPGIEFMMRYCFYDIIIIEKYCGIREAFSQSKTMTRGQVLHLLLFSIIGLVLHIVTLGLATPIYTMARIDVYKKLRGSLGF